ncbi:hypothetical protein VAWG006_38120 [Aeromonas enteropelogenes]|nr:hypothetical protein VAWG006_38120 [Aeromonas enteropelogenes]BEE23722.1 hypothetical protein VAWG007_38170 [Aeromonas enteropelogenes]
MQGARLGIGHGVEIPQGGGVGRFGMADGDMHLRLLLESFIMQHHKGPVTPCHTHLQCLSKGEERPIGAFVS